MATKKTEASKPAKPRKAATAPKMEDVAKAKGKQEFVKVARTKNKPRTWVVVYKLMTGPDVDVKKSRGRARKTTRS